MRKHFLKIFFAILVKIIPIAGIAEIGYELYEINKHETVAEIEYTRNYIIDAKLCQVPTLAVVGKLKKFGISVDSIVVDEILRDLRDADRC